MTSSDIASRSGPRLPLSLTRGGPLFRLQLVLGMQRSARARIFALVALTWGVGMVLALVDLVLHPGAVTPVLLQFGPHVRLLVGIPLLVSAELLLEARGAAAARHLFDEGFIDEAHRPTWDAFLVRLGRWRDAWMPEAVFMGAVALLTVTGLVGVLPGWMFRWLAPTLHDGTLTASRAALSFWWFVLVSQPILLFLLLRWLWSWLRWSALVLQLPRLSLRLQASHPDRAGGLGFLERSLTPLATVVLCTAAILSATWADEIRATGAAAASFAPFYVALVATAFIIGLGPFLPMTAVLLAAREQGRAAYGRLAREYISDFDAVWLTGGTRPRLLGTPEIQSLADLGTSFTVIEEMRVSVVSRRWITRLLVASVLPLGPLLLAGVSAAELARLLITHAL